MDDKLFRSIEHGVGFALPRGLTEAIYDVVAEQAFRAGHTACQTGYGSSEDGRGQALRAFMINPDIFKDD